MVEMVGWCCRVELCCSRMGLCCGQTGDVKIRTSGLWCIVRKARVTLTFELFQKITGLFFLAPQFFHIPPRNTFRSRIFPQLPERLSSGRLSI